MCSIKIGVEVLKLLLKTQVPNLQIELVANKRGRPEKIINIDNVKLWAMLKEYLVKNISDIWKDHKYDTRADTLRVRIMRQAK